MSVDLPTSSNFILNKNDVYPNTQNLIFLKRNNLYELNQTIHATIYTKGLSFNLHSCIQFVTNCFKSINNNYLKIKEEDLTNQYMNNSQ